MTIIRYDTIDSTNSEALRRLPELENLSVLLAREQTAGRGQRGNTWFTEPGKNLTFSIVLKFGAGELAAVDANRLNILASVAVAQLLDSYGLRCSIKWPNDIYSDRQKICGILAENSLSAGCVASSVMGIGININQKEFPRLANATSLSLCTGREYDLEDCLKAFLDCFSGLLPQLNEPTLTDWYSSRLFQKGVIAIYRDLLSGEEFRGTIVGVEPDGRLRITPSPSGEDRLYRFKEVGYIL